MFNIKLFTKKVLLAGQDGGQTNSLDFTFLLLEGPAEKVQEKVLTNIH